VSKTTKKQKDLDLSAFPPGSVTEFSTLVCLACTFDIFTTQLGWRRALPIRK
jgi:hypothetical protein